ncbi:MAG: hypothetical protein HYR85_21455 [Planctomycetes bacterium]|nr:hypothetical protein [Planctomycetota bacterium]
MPLLPKSTVPRLIYSQTYRKLPKRGFVFSHLLPRLAASPFNNEWLWDREEVRMYAERMAYALRRVAAGIAPLASGGGAPETASEPVLTSS